MCLCGCCCVPVAETVGHRNDAMMQGARAVDRRNGHCKAGLARREWGMWLRVVVRASTLDWVSWGGPGNPSPLKIS